MQNLKLNDVLDYIFERPVDIAHQLGFNDMTEIHNEWIIDFMLANEDKTLQAHRGSYKSTAVSVALALIILLFPKKSTLFMRKTDDNVKFIIKQVSKILKTDIMQDLSRLIYGRGFKFLVDNDLSICTDLVSGVKGDNQLDGLGIRSALTSKHYDIIFTDDIITLEDRISKAEREKTKLIYQELQSVKNRDGRIYNIGTPWHEDDCFVLMPKPKKYDCYTTGLISREELEQLRQTLPSPSIFSANYELKHISEGERLFSNPKFFDDNNLLFNGICHVDARYTGNDGSAFTICHKVDNKFYVLGKRRDKHIDDCIDEFISYKEIYKGGTIHLETNADKGYLEKEIKNKGIQTKSYHEDMNKDLKIKTYLRSNWANIEFHKDTDVDYINEILEYSEQANHDDSPDSLASILRILGNRPSIMIGNVNPQFWKGR